MNRFLSLLILICMSQSIFAQYVYTIKADSVKITNSCDTAELIIENHTQNVSGFLFNKGRGRTEFRKGLIKLNDTMFGIGADTLRIPKVSNITASNGVSMTGNAVQLGQSFVSQGNPAQLTSDRFFPMAGHSLSFNNGNVGIGGNLSVQGGNVLIDKPVADGDQNAALTVNSYWNTSSYAQTLLANTYNYDPSVRGSLMSINLNDIPVFTVMANGTSSYIQTWRDGLSDAYFSVSPIGNGGSIILLNDECTAATNNVQGSGLLDQTTFNASGTNTSYSCLSLYPAITGTGTNSTLRGIYFYPSISNASAKIIAFENGRGDVLLNTQPGDAGGRTGIHKTTPSAWLHLGSGNSVPNSAPLKFSPGAALATPEDGAVEYDGTDYFITQGTTRYKLTRSLTGQLTTNFGGPSLSAFNSVTTTVSVAGAQPGDVVNVSANSGAVNPPSIIITAYVTSAGTVTLQAYNASNSAVTVASDTYKVRVIK